MKRMLLAIAGLGVGAAGAVAQPPAQLGRAHPPAGPPAWADDAAVGWRDVDSLADYLELRLRRQGRPPWPGGDGGDPSAGTRGGGNNNGNGNIGNNNGNNNSGSNNGNGNLGSNRGNNNAGNGNGNGSLGRGSFGAGRSSYAGGRGNGNGNGNRGNGNGNNNGNGSWR